MSVIVGGAWFGQTAQHMVQDRLGDMGLVGVTMLDSSQWIGRYVDTETKPHPVEPEGEGPYIVYTGTVDVPLGYLEFDSLAAFRDSLGYCLDKFEGRAGAIAVLLDDGLIWLASAGIPIWVIDESAGIYFSSQRELLPDAGYKAYRFLPHSVGRLGARRSEHLPIREESNELTG